MEMAELPEQGALRLGVARVEFPQLGVEQVVEEKRAVLGAVCWRDFRIKAAPPLGFLAGHNCPTDDLCIAEYAGLDGFVLSWGGHEYLLLGGLCPSQQHSEDDITCPTPLHPELLLLFIALLLNNIG